MSHQDFVQPTTTPLTPRHQTSVVSPPTVPHSGYAAQHAAVTPSPSTPFHSGLLAPEGDKHQHVVRVRGLRHVHDTNQVSSVITHFLATPVTVSAQDMGKGHKYVSVSRLTFQMLFAQAPVRHYSYKLDIESKQASGDPLHMPLDSPESLATKHRGSKSKRPNKTDKAKKKQKKDHEPPHPPPPYERGPERLDFEPRYAPERRDHEVRRYYDAVPRDRDGQGQAYDPVVARGLPFDGRSRHCLLLPSVLPLGVMVDTL